MIMAVNEEASPICRGKNLSWETVMLFFNYMPKEPMVKDKFNAYVEKNISSWTQTHSQIARQLGFYYENDGVCYPRFDHASTLADLFDYMVHWAHNYFIPNPYAPSLKGNSPTSIYAHLLKCINSGNTNYDTALDSMFGTPLSSHDKVRVYLQNYTNIKFDNGEISVNQNIVDDSLLLTPSEIEASNTKAYYMFFDKGMKEVGKLQGPPKLLSSEKHFQQIFYGAPGTGKSYTINHDTKSEDVIRTTFHPDSDYSSFVGAYKPTTVEETVMTVIGTKAVPVENADGSPRKESKIVYEFVSQAFLQAYVEAWKKFANAGAEAPQKQYLVIEEINRGNCAQIFGDLFQLLDRNDNGFSDYPIKADADMKRRLAKSFVGLTVAQADSINAQYDGRNVVKEVLGGDILLLPNNLYIWATMNTSDQSLFPIDSAFKRRWDWIYMPISNANLGWVIDVEGTKYDWWQFLEKINDKIGSTTNSEDKKLGYFFCKAKDGEIKVETFVGKVIFYLWNDVFKDFEFGDSIFDDADGGKLEFAKFYTEEGKGSKVVADKVDLFLKNLGLEPVSINAEEAEEYEGQQESAESTEAEKNEWNATETKRYEFWEAFLNYAQQNEEFAKYFGGVKKASKDHWKNFFITGVAFNLVALQQRKKNAAEVQVYIFGGNEVYQHLLSYKTEIEQEMGVTYDWRELPEKKASIISERMLNVNFDDKESWNSIFNFFVDRLLRMREVFVKYSNKQ